ncbi:phosphopantetheine attachment site family protein [Burkholderia pseudomallei MSHR435]|nr:phosphopantetheine attachment site family protein [Burkholderia pseudomallei MSHR435]
MFDGAAVEAARLAPDAIGAALIDSLARRLLVSPQSIGARDAFDALGVDSLIGQEWLRELNRTYGTSIDGATLAECGHIGALASRIAGARADAAAPAWVPRAEPPQRAAQCAPDAGTVSASVLASISTAASITASTSTLASTLASTSACNFGCNFGFGFDLGFGFGCNFGFDSGLGFDFDFGLGCGLGRGRNDARGRSVRAAHHARCARACAGGQPREGALHGRRRHRHRTAVHGDGTRFDRRCRVGPPGEPRLRNRHQRDSGLRLSEHRDVRGARRIADERGRRGGRGCRVRCRRLRLKR